MLAALRFCEKVVDGELRTIGREPGCIYPFLISESTGKLSSGKAELDEQICRIFR